MSRFAFLHPALLGMGLHVAAARARRAIRGHRRYAGTAEEILAAGLEDCWSGRYLTASPGHYRQVWTRDLGFAAPSLTRLGEPWPARVASTLDWAIDVWRARGGHVTTTINPLLRWPADIFDYGVDSLPLLLTSLRAVIDGPDGSAAERGRTLVDRHRGWLASEVEHFVERVVDPSTGLVRTDRAFSAHRDTFKNGSTAYANTMVALLARTLAETRWVDTPAVLAATLRPGFAFPSFPAQEHGPEAMPVDGIRSATGDARMPAKGIAGEEGSRDPEFGQTNAPPPGRPHDWGALLRTQFWLGDRFRDRLGTVETSGEANVAPFFFGVVEDDAMLRSALDTLRRDGFTAPYPLRFEASHRADGLLLAYRLWSPDYQTTTSWTSLGSMYLSLLRRVDPTAAAVELDRLRALIERDGTFWEVLDARGLPWRSRSGISVSDQSMLWGAILLEELRRI